MTLAYRITALALTCAALTLGGAAHAEHWPHWRGPSFDGTSTESGLPTTWSAQENVRWRLALPGPAASTPVVWGDRVFLTSTRKDTDELLVLAVSTAGGVLWERAIDRGSLEVFQQFRHETSAATPSPVTDGTHVWALFGTGRLVCLDFAGEIVWQTELAERYGEPNMFFGLSMSPLLHGDRLYLQLLHADAQLVVALDKRTGEEVWKANRPTDARGECLHSYASPMPLGDTVLIHGADFITAHAMEDGTERWRYGTLNPEDNYNPMFRLVATPVIRDGLVVVPTAKRGPVFGLRTEDLAGAITRESAQVSWALERGTPDVPSPLVVDGLVYLGGERGTLTVLDADNGEAVYSQRVHESPHRASPVYADGKLLLTGTDGTVSVLRAGRHFELLAKNGVDEYLAASPAVAGGTIYLRTYEALWAIGLVAAAPSNPAAVGPVPSGD